MQRVEIITGKERRRRWSEAEKTRLVAETLEPGAIVAHVARRHGVAESCLYTWRRHLVGGMADRLPPDDAPLLIPVSVDIFDVHQAHKGAAAKEVLERIGRLYAVEERVRGQPAARRAAARQAEVAPETAALRTHLDQVLRQVSGKSALAEAIRYALSRWPALTRYLADGRLEIDNNIAERAMRAVALGRKNWLFAGSDGGGEAAAVFYTLIETAKTNGHNPRLWLTRVLEAIGRERDLTDYNALLPWTMKPEMATT
ncbi:transposase [Azospirillum brasilense]|nr:transposase [Azospirillum argentinense]